jgi:hypothetical protein
MIIAGGKTIESLYMGPALGRLARFPNVRVVPCCSSPQNVTKLVKRGRPTDFLPRLLPTDVLYVCGAPPMVESIKSIAGRVGAVCYADPFVPNAATEQKIEEASVLSRVMKWLAVPTLATQERIAIEGRQKRQLALAPPPRKRRDQPAQAYGRMAEAEARMRSYYGRQSA